jgi:C-terminal processing protease CtpA/Prc
MIGRLTDDKLTVSGVKTSSIFEELIPRMAEEKGFKLSATASGFGASDQTQFYTKKMPVLHFFTGLHKDYHKPSDTADKINSAGAVRVLDLIADLADTIARGPERPDYQKVKMKSRGERAALKVRMGIMPGFGEDDEDGMSVTGVIEDGPADRAGMQDGDRIISIGENPVNNIYDYMDALSEFEPGQDVVVRITRDGQRISLRVKLAASKR